MLKAFLRHYFRSGIGWSAVALVLLFVGCSNFENPLNSPTSETVLQTDAADDTPDILTKSGILGIKGYNDTWQSKYTGDDEPVVSVSQLVSAKSGGILKLHDLSKEDGRYKYILQIPPGALSEDTMITMGLASEDIATLDFFPEGLQFNKPARLLMYVRPELRNTSISGENNIYWYNPATEGWEAQGGSVGITENGRVQGVVNLQHFSRYSLGGDNPIQKWRYQSWYFVD